MVRRDQLVRIGLGVVLWVCLVGIFLLLLRVGPSFDAPGAVYLWASVAIAFALVGSRVSDAIIDRFLIGRPALRIEPMNSILDGKLSESQFCNMVWTHASPTPRPQNQLSALFGVLRVICENQTAVGCRARIRCRTQIPSFDHKTQTKGVTVLWQDAGSLNWYSATRRRNLTTVDQFNPMQLPRLLEETSADLHNGESRDLLLCCLLIDSGFAIICSDMVGVAVPMFPKDGESKFWAEITLSAQNVDATIHSFDVTLSRNSIRVDHATLTG